MSTEVRNTASTDSPHLRRELHLWEAVGISLALMAPSMAANINPQGTAGTVGRAVPLAFALATIGVLLIAWGFFTKLVVANNLSGFVAQSYYLTDGGLLLWPISFLAAAQVYCDFAGYTLIALAPEGHPHRGGSKAHGRAGAVDGHVAAADDDHPFADGHFFAQGYLA